MVPPPGQPQEKNPGESVCARASGLRASSSRLRRRADKANSNLMTTGDSFSSDDRRRLAARYYKWLYVRELLAKRIIRACFNVLLIWFVPFLLVFTAAWYAGIDDSVFNGLMRVLLIFSGLEGLYLIFVQLEIDFLRRGFEKFRFGEVMGRARSDVTRSDGDVP